MNQQRKYEQGFTLIELTLSMVFISVLLMSITMVTMQLLGLYNKGLTLKQVNAVSRTVVRDMQESIANAQEIKIIPEGETTPVGSLADAAAKSVQFYDNPTGGRLCTGKYSYAWNYRTALESISPLNPLVGNPKPVQYTQAGASPAAAIGFVKAEDPDRKLCRSSGGSNSERNLSSYGLSLTDVFGKGDNNLMLYSFKITSPADVNNYEKDIRSSQSSALLTSISTFYHITIKLGTAMGAEDIGAGSCKTPAELTDNEKGQDEYCAINEIDFVARTSKS